MAERWDNCGYRSGKGFYVGVVFDDDKCDRRIQWQVSVSGWTELYYTDGTPGGTGAFDVNFRGQMTNVNGTLFLGLSSTIAASAGVELWKTNGTVGGLTLVRDIVPGSNSSDPFQLTNVNGQLYFFTNSAAAQRGLWTSDGTAAGTRMVKQLTTDRAFTTCSRELPI